MLLHFNTFIYTSNTAGVLLCYHYTWAFAPSIVNLELRCGMYQDGHTAVSHWHPFWWIRHLFWLVSAHAMQLLIVFNINSNLLLSSVGRKKVLKNSWWFSNYERLSYGWIYSRISPSYSHGLILLHWARWVPLTFPAGLVLFFCKAENKDTSQQTCTYLKKVGRSHWGFILNEAVSTLASIMSQIALRLHTAQTFPLII